jgi:hypothetical protein
MPDDLLTLDRIDEAVADEPLPPIRVWMTPAEGGMGKRGTLWTAECTVDGHAFTAQSRSGAARELARVLVDAGVPDRPMFVHEARRLSFAWQSFHAAAGRPYIEAAAPYHKLLDRR